MNGHAKQGALPMPILFNKTIEQCRQMGARGGRAHARNLRLLQSQTPLQPVSPPPKPLAETAHEASVLLDAHFPWLADAFVRRPSLRSQLQHLLGRPQGATLQQIMQCMGWDRERAQWFRNYLAPGRCVVCKPLPDGTRCYFLAS
jgi:hypothetical protein